MKPSPPAKGDDDPMHNPDEPAVVVVEVLGIYDADGGLRGEMSYVVGKLLGRAHCGPCDITHSAVRRRRAWDRIVESHNIPVRLAHRNELTAEERWPWPLTHSQ